MMSFSNSERTLLNAKRSLASSRDAIRRISSNGRSDNVGIVVVVVLTGETVSGT